MPHRDPAPSVDLGPIAVLIPVKAFGQAKRRLSPALDPSQRNKLVRDMAERVLRAAWPLPVAVVCDDQEVAEWARGHGAMVISEPGRGLNGAVEAGVDRLAGAGADRVIVAHADLPLAEHLAGVAGFDGVTVVPDRHRDGTNVLCVPSRSGFRFAYGPGSFARHVAEAGRINVPVRIVREPLLAWDVDVPEDLLVPSTNR